MSEKGKRLVDGKGVTRHYSPFKDQWREVTLSPRARLGRWRDKNTEKGGIELDQNQEKAGK